MRYYLLLLLLVSFNSHAELHKWVDADGKVHYTDKLPPADASQTEELHISSPRNTAPVSAPPTAKNIFEQEADLKKAQKAKEEAEKKAAQQQEAARTKQKNCELSRNQLNTLQNAPRLTTYNAQGEATLMDDAARQRSIEEANKNISQYCN